MLVAFLCAVLFGAVPFEPPEVQAMKDAYAARDQRLDYDSERADPAITKVLDLLVSAARKGMNLEQFSYVTSLYGGQPNRVDGQVRRVGPVECVFVRFGYTSRTVLKNQTCEVVVPKKGLWDEIRETKLHVLPSGCILVEQWQSHPDLHLTWFSPKNDKLVKSGEFYADFYPDVSPSGSPLTIKGNLVKASTVDPTGNLEGHAPFSTGPPRDTTWDCSSGRPKQVGLRLYDQEIRAADKIIRSARAAKHPTRLQRRIRRIYPEPGMIYGLGSKEVKPNIVLVDVGGFMQMKLKRTANGYRLIGVREVNE